MTDLEAEVIEAARVWLKHQKTYSHLLVARRGDWLKRYVSSTCQISVPNGATTRYMPPKPRGGRNEQNT